MQNSNVIRIGFDLDGVLLYNPIRIVRPIISWVKRTLLHKHQTKFFVPRGFFWESLFILFHKTSLFVAPGYEKVRALGLLPKVELYLITARFSFLKHDLDVWKEKLNAEQIFSQIYYNELDEQPHLFKKRIINELKLAVFVEDNWDIVRILHENCPDTKIAWIYNIFDSHIPYHLKFPDLRKVTAWLQTELFSS